MLAGDDSLFVISGQVSRLFRPVKRTAFAHTFVFPHTADFRRPALVKSLWSKSPKKLCAFERASSRQTEVDAKLPRKQLVDGSGETQPREFQFDLKWPAYTQFRSPFKIFFSCRKSCKSRFRSAGTTDFATYLGEEHCT